MQRKGRGAEFLQIREYLPGEDARYLDWKATARLERPMIREQARETERRATVVVDPARPAGRRREEGDEAVETAISRAAGALHGLASRGWSLRLVTPGGMVGDGLTGSGAKSRAVIRDGSVYFAGFDGALYSLDAATGEILWGYEKPTRHVHSVGLCSDIDPRHPGAEAYSVDTDAEKKPAFAFLW